MLNGANGWRLDGRPLAPHVQAAIASTAQRATAQPVPVQIGSRPLAAHVQAAVVRAMQPAVGTAQRAAAQPLPRALRPAGPPPTTLQRALDVPVMSPGQQQVIDQGNVHRREYNLTVPQIDPMQTLVERWGNTVPTYDQFEADTRVFFALRSSDPALTQIDNLLRQFHAAGDDGTRAVYASHLLLACNFWLRKVNVAPANTRPLDFMERGALTGTNKLSGAEGRRAGILALAFLLEHWLNAHGRPHALTGIVDSMTRENRGVGAGHHYADVHQWNMREAARIPRATATAEQRGAFHADPDTRLVSLDDDRQKRLAKLVFRGGRAYRWRNLLENTGFALFSTGPAGVHYVMDKRGRIYAGTLTGGYFWHSSLVGFADALSAGFIVANQGNITRIKNDSGHYHPRAQEMVNMLLRLQLYGVNLTNVQVERMAATHPLGAGLFTAAAMLAATPGQWPDE